MGGDISLVEFSKSEEENMDSMANRSEQNIELGLTMEVGACSLLGLCRCVYGENVLKVGGKQQDKQISLWLQNFVLSIWSMLLTLLPSWSSKAAPDNLLCLRASQQIPGLTLY